MDIRKFLTRNQDSSTAIKDDDILTHSVKKQKKDEPQPCCSTATENIQERLNDLGNFIDQDQLRKLTDSEKYFIITNRPKPDKTFDFKKHEDAKKKRSFRHEWFEQYHWLTYSEKLKGALCINCVLFKPSVKRGFQGSFIVKPFTKYNDFHESAKNHANSEWHKESLMKSQLFMDVFSGKQKRVDLQLNKAADDLIEANRIKISSIISTIVYCGTHDIALRGKKSTEGNFRDLLEFRVESGDKVLQEHLETCSEKAKYTSHRIQNEIINICGQIIRNGIVSQINNENVIAFSLLADETADISGIEQLSVGVRFLKKHEDNSLNISEDFLGFVQLNKLDASSIAHAILNFCEKLNINMSKLRGLGFDGCSTMAGKEGGVQKIIRDRYPKALYFHCASHRLNLVVNDLNAIPEIQNTIATIKEVIQFFRESTLRRKLVSNIPLLCETRWSAKYKSIRLFSEKFIEIKKTLENLSTDAEFNKSTRTKAHQLSVCTSESSFIISLKIISKYSSILEPVTNVLQGISIDMLSVKQQIESILSLLEKHRDADLDTIFSEIFRKSLEITQEFGIELKMPRTSNRQVYRANYETQSVEEYFKRSIFIRYLDSLICSLKNRFANQHEPAFLLYNLHPNYVKNHSYEQFVNIVNVINTFYDEIDNFQEEALAWYYHCINSSINSKELSLLDVLQHCQFYPAVQNALQLVIALPPTTCTIERSFSTLRRVKTWLRSTMSEKRLDGLCMMSVHRDFIKKNKLSFIENVISEFSKNVRNLNFAFSSTDM